MEHLLLDVLPDQLSRNPMLIFTIENPEGDMQHLPLVKEYLLKRVVARSPAPTLDNSVPAR
jgi:hypothetical protein